MNAPSVLLNALQTGLLHPLTVPAHAVALIGLGLMMAQQSRRRTSILAFAVGLIAGLAALVFAVGETQAYDVLLAATAVAGLAAAIGWPMPVFIAAPLALVIGASIGLDSPPKSVSIMGANAMLIGTAVGAIVVVWLVAAIAARFRRGWLRIGVRVLGSWVSASAILVIALRAAR